MSIDIKNDKNNFEFNGGLKKVSIILMFIGLAAFAASFGMNKTVGWVDLLVTTLFFVLISVSGVLLLALTGVMQASWMTPYKRIPEAMTTFLPVGMILMLCMYFGLHTLYEWTHTEMVMNDPILREKVAWLNETGFMCRMIIIFSLWIGMAYKFRKFAKDLTPENGLEISNKTVGFSAISIILFGLTISVASWDWIMSLEPHWFSTIFGVYLFSICFVVGICFITLAVIQLKKMGYLGGVNVNHYHDLGKWMFGFSVFWAYIWVSQYILIWYANIPEETEYYVLRHHHWNGIFWFNLAINFFFPFFALMTRAAKRNVKRLQFVAVVLLVGHFIDIYLMVAPKVFEHHNAHVTGYGALQALELLGGFGLFIFVVGKALTKVGLTPTGDPTLDEGSHLHQ